MHDCEMVKVSIVNIGKVFLVTLLPRSAYRFLICQYRPVFPVYPPMKGNGLCYVHDSVLLYGSYCIVLSAYLGLLQLLS